VTAVARREAPREALALSIRDLSVSYRTDGGTLHALRRVSLDVPRGEIVGLVGESGCGKSTLISAVIRLMAGNARIESGSIRLDGRDLLDLDEREMRALRGDGVAMVSQDPMTSLNPVLTVGRQMLDIQFRMAGGTGEKMRRSARMLERVGIPDPQARLADYPHQLSGGMRQRVAIAMALMMEPTVLIADEPTTALDATLEVQIIHQLRSLQRDIGCSMLFISHHLGVIAELCDRVVVMYAGEVVESGTVREIFHRPQHPYTRMLLACDPGAISERTRRLPIIRGFLPNLVDLPSGCLYRTRCDSAFEECERAAPALGDRPGGRRVACHLPGEAG
jgi:oligopeptide/dipeptide ABC transporter ATP-binding protein